MIETLGVLSPIPGISGREDAVREAVLDRVAPYVDEASVDSMGNLDCVKRSKNGHGEKVMVCAHMDEVGLMVAQIDSNGLLKCRTVGGIDPRVLTAQRVRVGQDNIPGVIGMKPIHLSKPEERTKNPKIQDLSVDVGGSSKEETEKWIKVGDGATFDTKFEPVGDLVKGKAFDDRMGCAVLVELLKEAFPFELHGVFTVQEEVGLRGAKVAGYRINPRVCVTLEGTICDDLPDDKDRGRTTRLGDGAVITLRDRSVVCDRRLVSVLMKVAERDEIPFQWKRPLAGGTDAGSVHLSREGIPSCVVSTPCRYIHSPASMASPEDAEAVVRLVRNSLEELCSVAGEIDGRSNWKT